MKQYSDLLRDVVENGVQKIELRQCLSLPLSESCVSIHGENFVKRLENAVPMKKHKDMMTRIDFLVPFAAKKIAIKLDSPRNYLTVAIRIYEEGRMRDSLGYIRKAFEEGINRLWKKVADKKLPVQISVGMRGPGDPDLMSLVAGLYKLLDNKEVSVFQEELPLLNEMIGYSQKHRVEWKHMN